MKLKYNFHTFAIITVIFWSLAYVYTKLTLEHISAFSLGFLRYIVASIMLIIAAYFFKIKPPKKKDLIWFVASGLTGFALYIIIFNYGTSFVTAATSSFIIATVPVFTALLASFFYKEKLKPFQWIAIIIEFLGIGVLTVYDGVLSINQGIIWLLIASVLLSFYNIIQRRLIRTYPALQTATYSILIGTLFLFIFAPKAINEIIVAPVEIIIYVIVLGVFSSAIAYILWSKAFELAEKTSMVSNYMFLTPVVTSVLGIIIANEIPDIPSIVGGLIIIIGAIVFNKS